MISKSSHSIHARLFTAPGCPHCNGVKNLLEQLLQEESIGTMEIVDISRQADLAQELGIKSVPWLEMGPLIFVGEQKLQELREWVLRLSKPEAMVDYYQQRLTDGDLNLAEQTLQRNPQTLPALLTLIVRDELPLQVRIGIIALFEGFAGKAALQALIPELAQLLAHADYRIRIDIAHLLELTESEDAIAPLKLLLQDENAEVREIASEALEELEN